MKYIYSTFAAGCILGALFSVFLGRPFLETLLVLILAAICAIAAEISELAQGLSQKRP